MAFILLVIPLTQTYNTHSLRRLNMQTGDCKPRRKQIYQVIAKIIYTLVDLHLNLILKVKTKQCETLQKRKKSRQTSVTEGTYSICGGWG